MGLDDQEIASSIAVIEASFDRGRAMRANTDHVPADGIDPPQVSYAIAMTFRTGSTLDSLRYLSGVLAGRHHRMRGCVAERVRVVKVESASPVPFQLDGDPAGVLPCRFEVLPGRLSIVVPPDCRRLPRSARL